jgi:putative tricarboxylic transport membrane protein
VKLKNQKDACAGLLFVAIGAVAVIAAGKYTFGTTMRMGPGYFPVLLGGILIVLGGAIGIRALWSAVSASLPSIPVRPLLLVTLSLLVFALLLDRFGLVPAIVAAVLVSGIGGHEFRWREAVPLALFLAAASVLIFHVGLGLPFTLWSW